MNESNVFSHNSSIISPKKCYQVKEESSENEDEENEEVDNMTELNKFKMERIHQQFSGRLSEHGSEFIDEDGEKFLECASEGDAPDVSEHYESFHEDIEEKDVETPNSDGEKKTFKI
jgi:hypothetical protein